LNKVIKSRFSSLQFSDHKNGNLKSQKAGVMDRAKKLVKIRDSESENSFGYVFSVSGPGKVVAKTVVVAEKMVGVCMFELVFNY
jgi:hypothetical protein